MERTGEDMESVHKTLHSLLPEHHHHLIVVQIVQLIIITQVESLWFMWERFHLSNQSASQPVAVERRHVYSCTF
jgi:hypothetical protein